MFRLSANTLFSVRGMDSWIDTMQRFSLMVTCKSDEMTQDGRRQNIFFSLFAANWTLNWPPLKLLQHNKIISTI